MLTLSKTNQLIIALVLAAFVIMTRGHHFASVNSLPSASVAVFFLAGLYLSSRLAFPALLALCAGLDFAAITYGGVSGFCITPAYGFLLPAYGAMWLAGRWFAKHYSFSHKAIIPLLASIGIGASISQLFSSGGFYFFGGRYADPTFSVFGERLMKYFPMHFENLAFWLGTAAVVHITFALIHQSKRSEV